jgi:ribosome maturation factor RimP
MQFSDTETKIFNLLEKTINLLGFDLVLVSLVNDGIKTLKVIIDGKNGVKLSIDGCQSVSKAIAPILDVEDPISGKYLLEVSSAGVERPLVKKEDFLRFVGYVILIRLYQPVENKKKYQGKLLGLEDNNILLEVVSGADIVNKIISFESVKSANLVLTDDIFRAILKS